mmetsp:Transcript_21689/g.31563  ORF Transcript_21689/g.31563 Transcript_21689/m.31563 type:complete len:122 (+) Transcript_21689:83-448(+)|eukprot:CAMPEP_0185024190 /NCGR_PEP_ID=MMETSP1103-20130426/7160_1 /TAXON_ID=36769 /ORGANISM="Paraphysomonas bandaiensis, Strain Caron Lab Isolate" /LENGTH=121 /DNA_ID=CAMNT_0027557091 /DNA_START=28 /DNA_END=393 /DNA_ORIENTATION=-
MRQDLHMPDISNSSASNAQYPDADFIEDVWLRAENLPEVYDIRLIHDLFSSYGNISCIQLGYVKKDSQCLLDGTCTVRLNLPSNKKDAILHELNTKQHSCGTETLKVSLINMDCPERGPLT